VDKKERKHSNSEDNSLFREAVSDVKPIAARIRHQGTRPKKPIPRTPSKTEIAGQPEPLAYDPVDITTEPGEELTFRRDSISLAVMRDLKRGNLQRRDALDLHGLTSSEAQAALREFISYARSNGFRCVRVVHGKGHGSGNRGAVLKTKVNHWLRQWPEVLAFCSARPAEGGTGAVYVLLKTR
jgi:DNA-nicking Smr family endonuclease